MKLLIIPVALLTFLGSISAQNASDALRYSRNPIFGTARTAGVGGAFTALGADFGAISQNPAGLAMYRSNEFVFTPGIYFTSTDARIGNGTSYGDEATKFRFTNIGMVFHNDPAKNSKWTTSNVALGFNQTANYTQSTYNENTGPGTILKGWFDEAAPFLASGGDPESLYPLGSGLGYQAGAIYFQGGVPSYDFIDNPSAEINRTHSLQSFGGTNELSLSYAGNYAEKLLIGGSIGLPIVNYRQESTYTESDPNGGYEGNVYYFDNLTYTDYLRTSGIGINAKLGVNYRVSQVFRIGAAFHSPTFLNLTDNFNASLEYVYEDLTSTGGPVTQIANDASADAEPFNYRLRTPWKASFGGAAIINKYGFISADVEFTDYSSSHFNLTKNQKDSDTRAFERELNNQIGRNYKSAVNYRMGGELVLDQFRLRAGYGLSGKPQLSETGYNSSWSLGAGFRFESAYIDLAFRRSNGTGSVTPYVGSDAPVASTESKVSDVLMTVGFKF